MALPTYIAAITQAAKKLLEYSIAATPPGASNLFKRAPVAGSRNPMG
jgi:hypothetical protein